MDEATRGVLSYALSVLNMVADGRTVDYEGVDIRVQASVAAEDIENILEDRDA
jgi:hypothetical protein